MKEAFGIIVFIVTITCLMVVIIYGIKALIPGIKKSLYRILRNDMIKRLDKKGCGSQYINDLLTMFELPKIKPTFFTFRWEGNLKEEIKKLKAVIASLEYEIYRLKNPLPPAKFKIGQKAGNLVITSVGEDNSYCCIDADGKVHGCFRESDIEAMMKLNPKE